jgi:serine protease Do
MDHFVCVRLVQANAMDLRVFQFDYDLTFGVFFLNADHTVYGRFGSRSDRKLEGFRKAMQAALDLHKNYPANKSTLAGKQGRAPRFAVPEAYPSLKGKYQPKLDYEGKVVQSCLHCHQVREAERLWFRSARQPIPDEVLYPWPMPDVVGLRLDPAEKATVRYVTAKSPAEKAGFKAGDQIVALEGQPLLSIADVQWVLENTPQPGTIRAQVLRGKKTIELKLELPEAWRRANDISWRATSWDLRRMSTGGLLLHPLTMEERRRAGLNENELGLRVEHVGEYGEHAVAKKAGFKKNDIVTSVDGRTSPWSESQLMGYLLQNKKPGDRVPVKILRGGESIELELTMQ